MKYRLIAATLMVALTGAAQADRQDRLVNRLDENGDGLISIEEFQPPEHGKRSPLMRADSNDDGVVTVDELNAANAERLVRMRERMEERHAEAAARLSEHAGQLDQDGDGVITEAEARAILFNRLDQDGDGFLTAAELKPRKGRGGSDGPRRQGHWRDR